MSRILYLDMQSGISGDMFIGAMIDLGVPFEWLVSELKKMPFDGYSLSKKAAEKFGINGTKFDVELEHGHSHDHEDHHHEDHSHGDHHHGDHEHRNYHDICHLIDHGNFTERVEKLAKKMFHEIAVAEGKIHGKAFDEVHFHEVGAVDSIIDIVGAALCVEYMNIDEIVASPVHVGSGWVKCAHGLMPVPAPATLELLKDKQVYSKGIKGELTTPTGASIVSIAKKQVASMPSMTVKGVGYGMGTKDFSIPNTLRLVLGESTENPRQLYKLETNIDDMSGEVFGYLMEKLLDEGALDVYFSPIQMKKNRPAIELKIICDADSRDRLEQIVFEESSTLGIRRFPFERNSLVRRVEKVKTTLGDVNVKIASINDQDKKSLEYEDMRRLAIKNKIPLRDVFGKLSKEIL